MTLERKRAFLGGREEGFVLGARERGRRVGWYEGGLVFSR